MIKCFYDLHIHTSLSSCADDLMTLHNIVNMAKLKGLDLIAITDHNCAKNCRAFMEVANKADLLVIPGIEVETYEGIHILCYFRTLNDLLIFDKIVYKNLPRIRNNDELLGKQVILNEEDQEICYEVKMLNNSSQIKLVECINLVHLFKGIVVAAHIDRRANSLLTVLGFIPDHIVMDGLEVTSKSNLLPYIENKAYEKYRILQNSDAHYIGDICEKMNYLTLKDKTIDAFFDYFEERL